MISFFSEVPSRIRSQQLVRVAVPMFVYVNSAILALFVPLATFPLPPKVETYRSVSWDVEEG